MASVRSELRARLERGETIIAPGAYDPLGARVVQALGFRSTRVATCQGHTWPSRSP